MLHALVNFMYKDKTANTVVVKAPRLYLFDRETNTQLLEDLNDTTDLKTIFLSSELTHTYPGGNSASMGRILGSWLRAFHSWTSAPEQAALRANIGRNNGMRKLKRQITYDSFLEILVLYPQVLEGHLETLQAAKDSITAEFEINHPPDNSDESWGIIHGDFWSGKSVLILAIRSSKLIQPTDSINCSILLPNRSSQDCNEIYIIDWEFAQFGHRAIDVGGMLADLYERKHFREVDDVLPAMQGFACGYGPISDEMAFRTCIHVGVHLICWHIRRNPNLPLPAPLDKVISALELGRDLIVKGWDKDRKWLEGSVLSPLFA